MPWTFLLILVENTVSNLFVLRKILKDMKVHPFREIGNASEAESLSSSSLQSRFNYRPRRAPVLQSVAWAARD